MKLALVGDVHGAWSSEEDAEALAWLGADVVLLVGDFGEEDLKLVREVASLPMPKAVVLGAAGSAFLLLRCTHARSQQLSPLLCREPRCLVRFPASHRCLSSKRVCTTAASTLAVLPTPFLR